MSALALLSPADLAESIAQVDWAAVETELDARGCAILPGLLSPEDCGAVTALYDRPAGFRSRVVMSRHGFGRGEYQYFAYPLPDLVQTLRPVSYTHLTLPTNREV